MSWIKFRSSSESLDVYTNIAGLCAELGGPFARYYYELVLSGRLEMLINQKIDYERVDVEDAIYARQIQALFSKLQFLELGIDKEESAWVKFQACEEKCRETNERLTFGRRQIATPSVEQVLHTAQRKISQILGTVPSFSDMAPTFGPGANTNVTSRCANPRVKLSAGLTCSTNATRCVDELLSEVPHWTSLHSESERIIDSDTFDIVNVAVSHGKLHFVPKTSLTHRSIVVEPLLNSFFQKGVGDVIRDRLMREGVNLRDQTRNQRLACEGSISGKYATVDLSSASDCISRKLVWDLLPIDWAELLDSLRTPSVTYRGRVLHLEKFSSMGNAYTFELESLLFYGLAFGVCESLGISPHIGRWGGRFGQTSYQLSVYGDDIIIAAPAVKLLEEVLAYVGFDINTDKSYATGPFRESCGADYMSGRDIRPFYPKTRVNERVLFTMHNWFVRAGEYLLAKRVHDLTHPAYRLYGPNGYGDGHLIGSYDLTLGRSKRRAGWEGGYFETYSLKPVHFRVACKGDAVLPVYSVYTRSGQQSPTDPDVVRGTKGYAKLSIYTLSRSVLSSHALRES